MADRDWTESLPRALKLRFDGLGNYVSAVLEEHSRAGTLSRNAIRQIHIIAFIKSLDDFLREGTQAAVRAVDQFESLGVRGFRIGSEEFAGRNDAVMRGQVLADRLRNAVANDSLGRFLSMDRPLREVILQMARDLSGRRMG
jgi:hypothetical protein